MGGVITSVEETGIGAKAALMVGDVLLAVNGHSLRDVIDVQYYAAEETLELQVERQGQQFTVSVERDYQELLGLAFARPTFDSDIRRCDNKCEFCFVVQMPSGLRRSLYVKDDDFRHSFLFGTYVTMTNLTEEDWERIEEQHLSPLYVTVQATDDELRRQLLRNQNAPPIVEQLQRLGEIGITVHTQVVVLPGLNDGSHLDRSINDLVKLYPTVSSVSVVPIGLTKFHKGGCRLHSLEEAQQIFEQVTCWQQRLKDELGVHFAHLSDEWYLRLDERVPPEESYDGLDLRENGVGLARGFLNSCAEVGEGNPGPMTLVTGELFAPVLRKAMAPYAGVDIVPVANRLFGETVTVAGLLAAQDVIERLQGLPLQRIALPRAMFGGPEGQSLDEMLPQQVGEALGCAVVVGDLCSDLF
jgi:putative radical SAM enzyme (TIGR03279 family)